MSIQWLDWPAPGNVKACYTLRFGGKSREPYETFNLGFHVGDNVEAVNHNRRYLSQLTGQKTISWLKQVHGTDVLQLPVDGVALNEADASVTQRVDLACCVMTADCLPVFFCDREGKQVAVAHAGWRGLLKGVLQNTLSHFSDAGTVLVYLGPAISQCAFEVGEEVRAAYLRLGLPFAECFVPSENMGRWMADLYQIARVMMIDAGVNQIYGGDRCTYRETSDFFSYRRDNVTGRMANLIWINS